MRIVRTVALGIAGAAWIPALVLAQKPADGFDNSWFWGIKGGASMFTVADGAAQKTAPSVGGEWLITRSRIALNISVDQSFFDGTAGVYDPTVNGSFRPVDISDWRRYQASIYFFPGAVNTLRPYAGLGLAINVIQNASPEGQFTSEDSQNSVFQQVSAYSSRASAVFTGGAQYAVGRAALFGQVNAMPTRNRFLISGSGYTFVLEGGVRYNVGSAIEMVK
ncbi:MAG: hypothetical protein MNPFHGCM_01425 [Gemmatimonadaceae bacterium]|nr:hypothetical protein [Gemmatimonadaceae bacterium]